MEKNISAQKLSLNIKYVLKTDNNLNTSIHTLEKI